jgi:erythritol transport system ATP-binding protein
LQVYGLVQVGQRPIDGPDVETDASERTAAIQAFGIAKGFGGIQALEGVDFEAQYGKVNVLLGENGAGKSTLMKILAGEVAPDEGRILRNGTEVRFHSPRDARAHGVALIHQELSVFPAMTVADNLFAGNERRRAGLVDTRLQNDVASTILARLGQRIDPRALVNTLAVGQQQLVEIAKALSQDSRVLIMDEPTSALSNAEVDALFGVIRELTASGVAIIYISHRMDEIFRIGDILTVFRDGRTVASAPAADVDMGWIHARMLGSRQREALARAQPYRRRTQDGEAAPALEVRDLSVADGKVDRLCLDGVSFRLKRGEVLGVFGLLGAGKTELAKAIAGHVPDYRGTVRLGGRVLPDGVPARLRAGIAMVPEDRGRDAVVRTTTVADNMLLSSFGAVARYGVVSDRPVAGVVSRMVGALGIRIGSSEQLLISLSGGNQQKAIIARALLTRPKVLILDEPTRGIDVGAKAEVYAIMRKLADEGLAVLFASSELPELMGATDRILVLSRGRVCGLFDTHAVSENQVLQASTATVTDAAHV